MRRTQGQTRAPIALLWPALAAACLASAGVAQACPSSSYNSRKAAEERAAALQAADTQATVDCPYSKRGKASPFSSPSTLAFAAVPAALGAFALGWRSGGRRRSRSS
ncbi:MAG TPA: hypothetical protein VFS00_07440 [Polyangiaceae bacterium]|nr:hypothetical protein [Polyangiaceae bacterium]